MWLEYQFTTRSARVAAIHSAGTTKGTRAGSTARPNVAAAKVRALEEVGRGMLSPPPHISTTGAPPARESAPVTADISLSPGPGHSLRFLCPT
ncbi:hypothetical protein J6590_000856 [Homalodisca vitripennis]|nr:hypothetical protein J6590_000856 [Homalodisca vitripennis]